MLYFVSSAEMRSTSSGGGFLSSLPKNPATAHLMLRVSAIGGSRFALGAGDAAAIEHDRGLEGGVACGAEEGHAPAHAVAEHAHRMHHACDGRARPLHGRAHVVPVRAAVPIFRVAGIFYGGGILDLAADNRARRRSSSRTTSVVRCRGFSARKTRTPRPTTWRASPRNCKKFEIRHEFRSSMTAPATRSRISPTRLPTASSSQKMPGAALSRSCTPNSAAEPTRRRLRHAHHRARRAYRHPAFREKLDAPAHLPA